MHQYNTKYRDLGQCWPKTLQNHMGFDILFSLVLEHKHKMLNACLYNICDVLHAVRSSSKCLGTLVLLGYKCHSKISLVTKGLDLLIIIGGQYFVLCFLCAALKEDS